MTIDTVITLVAPAKRYQDEYGIWRDGTETTRNVLARVSSIDRREFFSAGTAGYRPEHKFTIFADEYLDEEICEYMGKRYAVYRTYRADADYLELYVQRKVGVGDG